MSYAQPQAQVVILRNILLSFPVCRWHILGASIYLREKIELQQEKEYERKYITASMTGEQDAERLI